MATNDLALNDLMVKSAEFHGHLGPFLVLGIRMGLTGLRRLGVKSGGLLGLEIEVPLKVPFSCIIDGLQISTRCTVGNRKLTIRNAQKVKGSFRKDVNNIIITLNHEVLSMLRSSIIGKSRTDQELQDMALEIASIPTNELLCIQLPS